MYTEKRCSYTLVLYNVNVGNFNFTLLDSHHPGGSGRACIVTAVVPAVTGEDSGALCSALGDGLGLAGLQVTSVSNETSFRSSHKLFSRRT